jgi:hypothetical protein
LVFAVHTGALIGTTPVYPLSFAIRSLDPMSPTDQTTMASRTEGAGFRKLGIASQTGALYYQYFPAASRNQAATELIRVAGSGGSPAVVATATPLASGFFISADETRLLARAVTSETHSLFDLTSGAAVTSVNATYVLAMSPDASEALVGSGTSVVTLQTGATRTLSWASNTTTSLIAAAWVGGKVRLLLQGQEFVGNPARSRITLTEWEEGGTPAVLGSVETMGIFAFPRCAAWSPATRSAVLVSDSLSDGSLLTDDPWRTYQTIVAMSGGTATKIGSYYDDGLTTGGSPTCALSGDGKWFAYRPSTDAIYLRAAK